MEHILKLKNKVTEINLLPSYVNTIGKILDISPEDCEQLNLVLEEAVSNVISYAYPKEEEHMFEIRAICEERQLTLSVIDDGVPFDPTEHTMPDTTLLMEERDIGGLGIFLIHQMMDRVWYRRENGKNILTMCKNYGAKGLWKS